MKLRYKSVVGAALLCCALGAAVTTPTLSFAQATEEQQELARQFQSLDWYKLGQKGDIAGKATFVATQNHTFLNAANTDKFLTLNGNPPRGSAYTVAPTEDDWFAILSFSAEGYIKDDEKIDADALLASLKEGNAAESERRRKAGYNALTITGWAIPPRYDTANNRLEWATLLRDEADQSILANVSTKILGRSGYMNVTLVASSPENVEKDLADFKLAMANFSYVDGEKYSDWKQGDKVAAYGLGALVLGGAAAVATSKGGFKAIGIALLAGIAALWGGIKKFLGRKKESQ
ncbi:putative membrane-anchored protein [Hydrogenophaga palleronii]|uniref:Membrane-anchored protein n=1 Tax=Hydrogenophaga palleronii TaxID=65655 RepID=A0ABU1WTK4_9BURK|nr:DUF2167 domain-containing protein [Hydrogenophaga palleronii]MDR7152628.1 putative membrane-anchored protein [Hydrogenophaga palleronii]